MATMTPPESGVKIRLYRKFLGDCLLLAFPTSEPDVAFYMLIDCGAFLASPLEKVAKNIVEATGGDIDVVVMTHEHQDHLSGFKFAKPWKIFQDDNKISFRELWMAWTESKKDKLAKKLQKEVKVGMRGLAITAQALKKIGSDQSRNDVAELGNEVLELSDTFFEGAEAEDSESADLSSQPSPDETSILNAIKAGPLGIMQDDEVFAFAKTVDQARKNLLSKVSNPKKNHKTWAPGKSCQPLGEGGFRAYFLGPPKNIQLLRTDEVSGEHFDKNDPTHSLAMETAFHSAVAAVAASDPRLDAARPFGQAAEISIEQAQAYESGFFQTHYFGSTEGKSRYRDESTQWQWREQDVRSDEVKPGAQWRQIEVDWLGMASHLALQYDGYINNTSLVMALELPETGKVILLPGDAQGGNWQSWCDETAVSEIDGIDLPEFSVDGEEFDSIDLLRRTVFYKVSHHGSHNGTLQTGLDLIGESLPDEPKYAMIPTDEMYAWTKKKNGRWIMPYLPLYKALLEKTEGRLVQGDFGLPDQKEKNDVPHPNEKFKDKPAYTDGQWDEVQELIEEYQEQIDELRNSDLFVEDDMYFEITILDE